MIIGRKPSLTCAALSLAIGATSLIVVNQIHVYQEASLSNALPGIYNAGG